MAAIPYDSKSCYILQSTRMTWIHLQHSRSHLDSLAFELSKLRFRGHNLFDEFSKIG